MKHRLALVPLVLALATPASGEVVVARAPIRQPVTQEPTYPEDGVFVYQPDPMCARYATSYTLPDLRRALCMRSAALDYLSAEIGSKRIIPGPQFTACNYAWSQSASWAGCVENAIRKATPEIRFGMSPYYVVGSVGGVTLPAQCVAGVSYPAFIRVSLSDPSRVIPLCAWEAANVILFYVVDRKADSDGPIVGAAMNYALAACPVN